MKKRFLMFSLQFILIIAIVYAACPPPVDLTLNVNGGGETSVQGPINAGEGPGSLPPATQQAQIQAVQQGAVSAQQSLQQNAENYACNDENAATPQSLNKANDDCRKHCQKIQFNCKPSLSKDPVPNSCQVECTTNYNGQSSNPNEPPKPKIVADTTDPVTGTPTSWHYQIGVGVQCVGTRKHTCSCIEEVPPPVPPPPWVTLYPVPSPNYAATLNYVLEY